MNKIMNKIITKIIVLTIVEFHAGGWGTVLFPYWRAVVCIH
jgi:hypothetical protein